MTKKRCPYCGKRISYTASFSNRRNAEYVCPRCGKESKVRIKSSILIVFAVFALIAIAIMVVWSVLGFSNNPLGIAFVALPLIIFVFLTPKFVYYEPLKKYKKSMEAKKAGIAYSDNLLISDFKEEPFRGRSAQDNGQFQINADVFNKIRAERNAAREQLGKDDISSNTQRDEISDTKPVSTNDVQNIHNQNEQQSDGYVHLIDNVSENHSYDNVPLKKIHSENVHSASRARHYIPDSDSETDEKPKQQKPSGNRYSSNRRF